MTKPKLTKQEDAALKSVRDMLEGGLLTHVKNTDDLPILPRGYFDLTMKRLFNMNVQTKTTECGSVACIGGWMAAFMGMSPDRARWFVTGTRWFVTGNGGGKFRELFYPPDEIEYDAITPKQAVKAIDNYRRTGKPRWHQTGAKLGHN